MAAKKATKQAQSPRPSSSAKSCAGGRGSKASVKSPSVRPGKTRGSAAAKPAAKPAKSASSKAKSAPVKSASGKAKASQSPIKKSAGKAPKGAKASRTTKSEAIAAALPKRGNKTTGSVAAGAKSTQVAAGGSRTASTRGALALAAQKASQTQIKTGAPKRRPADGDPVEAVRPALPEVELDEEQAALAAREREAEEERRLAAELGEVEETEEDEDEQAPLVLGSRTPRAAPDSGAPVRPRRAPPGSPIEPLARDEGLGVVPVEELWARYGAEVERVKQIRRADPEASKTSRQLEELRNELIERHYPLVRYHAERLLQTLPKSIELDDLVSAGQFGLMDAIRGFDPDRGIKFKTYCSTRIRGSILDQLRSQDWVPRLVRLKASKIDKALQRLTGEFGREPTHAELARHLEMDPTDLSKEMNESQAKTMFSLSEKWDDDDDGAVEKVEIIEDRDAIDPVQELNRRDLMLFITRSLSHKERFIVEQYYHFGHTMREIGEMLALTESRVCQIHSNVMGRLKDLLEKRNDTLAS